eukprot:CAMPEP_0179121718 /NCGR_PEP_ID=MMETSP0796-20121207/57416_1 /TAXON_ID=73915 /ORGANISM="Pyrodinium bahamense, Strain pbaha01" /LENGTH=130 /DNA_ID=CAMNT_0020820321 /DNA_START=168 /DNA_END=558 /DNA_ORIENTATION=+
MNDMWRADTLGRARQLQFCDRWRQLRTRCYDLWLNDLQSDALMAAHDQLRDKSGSAAGGSKGLAATSPWRDLATKRLSTLSSAASSWQEPRKTHSSSELRHNLRRRALERGRRAGGLLPRRPPSSPRSAG